MMLRGGPTGAGDLTDRISIERSGSVVDDGITRQPGEWTEICQPWAQVSYGKGAERRAAAQENAGVPATFRIRANTITETISVTDRVLFDGSVWDITSSVPFGRAWRDITAIRKG